MGLSYVLAALVILEASNDLSGIMIDEALSSESKHNECLLLAKLFATNGHSVCVSHYRGVFDVNKRLRADGMAQQVYLSTKQHGPVTWATAQ